MASFKLELVLLARRCEVIIFGVEVVVVRIEFIGRYSLYIVKSWICLGSVGGHGMCFKALIEMTS